MKNQQASSSLKDAFPLMVMGPRMLVIAAAAAVSRLPKLQLKAPLLHFRHFQRILNLLRQRLALGEQEEGEAEAEAEAEAEGNKAVAFRPVYSVFWFVAFATTLGGGVLLPFL